MSAVDASEVLSPFRETSLQTDHAEGGWNLSPQELIPSLCSHSPFPSANKEPPPPPRPGRTGPWPWPGSSGGHARPTCGELVPRGTLSLLCRAAAKMRAPRLQVALASRTAACPGPHPRGRVQPCGFRVTSLAPPHLLPENVSRGNPLDRCLQRPCRRLSDSSSKHYSLQKPVVQLK